MRARTSPALLLLLSLLPGLAMAGAWTRTPGDLQVIATAGIEGMPLRQAEDDNDGAQTAQLYAEYGVTEGLTAGGSFWLEVVPTEPDQGSAALGGFLRQRLWQNEAAVLSLQAGIAAPVERWISAEFARTKPFSALDLGVTALYGRSWWGDWGSAFLSTGVGYHYLFEDQPAEVRGEVTLGTEPWSCCMAMLSLYGLLPVQEGLTDESLKIVPSVGWHLTDGSEGPRTTLQLGASRDLLRDQGFGAFLGVWQDF